MKSVIRPILACTVLGLAGTPTGALAAPSPAPIGATKLPGAGQLPGATGATPHGIVELIGDAIAQVTLQPDQEAKVEALSAEIEPLQVQVDNAENALLSALADQVQAGAIDKDTLAPLVAAYVAARNAVSPELRKAVESLHAILDADQRADFSDAIECGVHEAYGAMLTGQQLDDFAKSLGLSADQIAKIQEGLQSLQPGMRTQRTVLHQIFEAFRGDDFSVESILPQDEVSDLARARAERIIDLTATLAGALTQTQRIFLAARIREAVRERQQVPEVGGPQPAVETGAEHLGATADHLWFGRGFRGGWGWGGMGWGWGGMGRWGWGWGAPVYSFPFMAGWGLGW